MSHQKYEDLPTVSAWKPKQRNMAHVFDSIRRKTPWRPLWPTTMRTCDYMLQISLLAVSVSPSTGHLEYELTERGAAFAYYFLMESPDARR